MKYDQKEINENVDYINSHADKENIPQNNRMKWMLAFHSVLFAGFYALLGNIVYIPIEFTKNVICVLGLVALSLSASSVYSMLVGELSVDNILEVWRKYNAAKLKPRYVPHLVFAVPKPVLDSSLRFLSLYSFAPKVFFTAWAVIFINLMLIL